MGLVALADFRIIKHLNQYLRIKLKLRSYLSSEHNDGEVVVLYRDFGFLNLHVGPLDLANRYKD